ncbi:MAG TPA: DHHA1 domain-containing protein [Terriglobia bacterium]|nr:DHHA1 domain-containing protein [Terriglobia bacterium]
MGKTERLYYTDSFLREFDAKIVDTSPDGLGVRVYLDRTAFYPESGGQPSDRGLLGGARVLDVIDEGERIAHIAERNPGDETVRGTIDWPRRFDHMQQHTGQHVLSAAFERTGGYKTVSFHLGTEVSSIDLDSDRLGPRQIEAAESLANDVIFEDRPVEILFRDATEASDMALRKPTQRQGEVRLIQMADFDLSACGGTHVRSTGQIGLVSVRKVERTKGHLRIEFVCGGRALAASRGDFRTLEETARLFSAPFLNLPVLAARQAEELRHALRANEKLIQRLAELEAEAWWAQAELKNGRKVLQEVFEATDSAQAKALAHAVAQLDSAVALIGVKGKPAALFFSQSASGRANLGALMGRALAPYGGRGGGARNFAQGGGIEESRLAEALALAHSLLPESPDK